MSSKNKELFICLTLLAVAGLSACQSVKTVTTEASPPPQAAPKQANQTGGRQEDKTDLDLPAPSSTGVSASGFDFTREDGQAAFKFVHDKASGRVLSADGKTVLSFADENPKKGSKLLRVNGAPGNCTGYIQVASFNSIKIEDLNRKELYKLRFEKDNHFKLKDPQDNVLYKIKDEDYGLKIEEGEGGKTLYKVKVKDGKVKLKSADGKTILVSRGDLPPAAMACFGFDKLTKHQQYSLAYALLFLRL